jgi:hypothetical protein
MKRIRLLGLALMAVFAFSAVAAGMASAVEGPLFAVNGQHLRPGETRLLLASSKGEFTLTSAGVGITITCTGLTLPNAGEMQIEGVAPGNGGTSREVIQYTVCTVTGNGKNCEVEGGTITTNLVQNLLGYGNAARTGQVLVLFEPEKGLNFVTVKFVGSECKFKTTGVEGTVVGAAQVGGQPVLIGQPTESLHGEVSFPHVQLIFIEQGGALKHVKAGLKAFGVASVLKGIALLLVDEGGVPVRWGVLS